MSIDDHKGRRMQEPEKTLLQFKPPELRIHPFEKPQDLLKRLISISSVKGETVLDPFAGSGATILAAQALGRNGLGFELDSEHFNIAQNRLTAVAPK